MAEERRLVTVLFADVVGSTALGEALDPEDVRALLVRFYAIAREIINQYGGTLEKFIGDSVMAVFGLPQAHGDDPQRALTAAVALRDRVRDDVKLGTNLPVRIGVNTGEVVASRDPSATDFLVTGDAVNVAARLQQAAEPWAIFCGERTAHAALGFDFGAPRRIDAKGKATSISALPLMSAKTIPVMRRVPLVGRDADIEQLELVARRVVQERRPFLISLIAPAGIGKTRLVEEFLDRLPAIVPHATVAIAQCLPYGQRLTYWPLRGALFRLIGIAEDSHPAVIREAVRSWVRDAGLEEAERVANLLSATVGVGEVEGVDRDSLFGAWRAMIEAAAKRGPLVLIFEDLHWSSDSLLDLFEFVMQPRGESSVLMIALARPELLDRRPSWGGGRRNYVALALEPLTDDAGATLVGYLLPQSSASIVSKVVTRAEGNPFYAGEIVRSIVERGPSLDDEAAVADALARLPDTIQATVLARLDLLEPAARRVLQLGAVFGRTFRTPGISALAPDLASELPQLLDRLLNKDLIRTTEADRFTFRHILIRDVAYRTLPRADRMHLHARAGRWLEARAAGREESLAELIAYHYREAASLAPAVDISEVDRVDLKRKAVEWLTRAADMAAAGAASMEAVRHLNAAIELASQDKLPELYEALGDVYPSGDPAVAAYGKALALCREYTRPADQELRVLAGLLTVYTRWQSTVSQRPNHDELLKLRRDGRSLVARVHDQRAIAKFLVANSFYSYWLAPEAKVADVSESEADGKQGLVLAERLDDPLLMSAALDGLASIAQQRGSWVEAREIAQARLRFQDRLDLMERLDAHSMVAWASALLGDLVEADRVTALAMELVLPGQTPVFALHPTSWRTYTLVLLGKWDEALVAAERCWKQWIEAGRGPAGPALLCFLAALDVARAREDTELIARYTEVADVISRTHDLASPFARLRPYVVPDVQQLEAQVVRAFAEVPRAFSFLIERALAVCVDHGYLSDPGISRALAEHAALLQMRIIEAQARRALGLGKSDPAELTRALKLFQQAEAAPYVARVLCERGILTGHNADLTAGVRMLEALGDLGHLARLEKAGHRS